MRLAVLPLLLAACTAPVAAQAPSPTQAPTTVIVTDFYGGVIGQGGFACGIRVHGSGFIPGTPLSWRVRLATGEMMGDFLLAVDTKGRWQPAIYFPYQTGPMTISWLAPLMGQGGNHDIVNTCTHPPEKPSAPPTDIEVRS